MSELAEGQNPEFEIEVNLRNTIAQFPFDPVRI
jgi:hypothetical protein